MKISELNPMIFSKIAEKENLKIFQYFPASELDIYYLSKYSQRTANNLLVNNSIDFIANSLISLYKVKWNNALDYYLNTNSVILNNGFKITTNTTENSNNIMSDDVLEKVSGFNDDSLATDTERNTSNNNNFNSSKTSETIRSNSIYIKKNLEYLKNDFVYNIIFNDVNDLITLKIFE